MIGVFAVVLLCAVLPFVLSFTVDSAVLVLRRGRAGLPALVAAIGASVLVAGAGLLLVQLDLVTPGAAAPARFAALGPGLLMLCVPLAVAATLVRLWVTGQRGGGLVRLPGFRRSSAQ